MYHSKAQCAVDASIAISHGSRAYTKDDEIVYHLTRRDIKQIINEHIYDSGDIHRMVTDDELDGAIDWWFDNTEAMDALDDWLGALIDLWKEMERQKGEV